MGSAPPGHWKSLCITHLATCPNQNSPTDSADEAVFEVGEDHIALRLGFGKPAPTPTSLIPDCVRPKPKPESLQRLTQWAIEHGIDAPGEYRSPTSTRRPRGWSMSFVRAPAKTNRRYG